MIVIYRDNNANAIFIQDSNGVQFLNNINAYQPDPLLTIINIEDLSREIDIMTGIEYTEFEDDAGVAWGTDGADCCNNLNAAFQTSGSSGNIPVITSSLAVAMTQGDTLNYELLADFGVGYEWDLSNVPGITTVEGNIRKLIGGSSLSSAAYNIPVKAINYFGFDSETLVLTVSAPAYNNTISTDFVRNDYIDATPNTSNPLYRPTNGVGAADAWSITFWFKGGTSNNNEQTILMFGGSNQGSEGRVHVYWDGNNERLFLLYGTNNDYLQMNTPDSSLVDGVWQQVIITYDGGTTDDEEFNRFEIFIDGSTQTFSTDEGNKGYGGEIVDDFFRIGRNGASGNYLRNNCLVDEVALWDTDETANVAAIYNSGTPHNLASLTSAPDHYWRMGDGDTFPTISDQITTLDFTMFNMTAADFVNDVP